MQIKDKVRTKLKEKGEITGSTRKIKRQKGTGTARAGSIKVLCLEVVDEYLDQDQETIVSS